MDGMQLENNWQLYKFRVRQHWPELTEDDVTSINGDYNRFIGVLQKCCGYNKTEAVAEIDKFFNKEDAVMKNSNNLEQVVKAENEFYKLPIDNNEQMAQRFSEKFDQLQDKMSTEFEYVKDKVKHLAQALQEQTKDLDKAVEKYVIEHPVKSLAIAAVAGGLVAILMRNEE